MWLSPIFFIGASASIVCNTELLSRNFILFPEYYSQISSWIHSILSNSHPQKSLPPNPLLHHSQLSPHLPDMGREHNNCLGGRCSSRNGIGGEGNTRGSELLGENSYNRGNRYRNGEDRAMLYPRPGATRDIVDSLLSQSYQGGNSYGRGYSGMNGMGGGLGDGLRDFSGLRGGDLGGLRGGMGGMCGTGMGESLGGLRGGMGMGGLGGMGMGHEDHLPSPLGRRGNFPRSPLSPHDSLPFDPHRMHPNSIHAISGRQAMMSGALQGGALLPGSGSRSRIHSPASSIFDPYRMDRPRMPYGPDALAGRRPSNYRSPYVEDYESEIEADMAEQAMMQHMYGMGEGYFPMDGGYGYGGGIGGMHGMGGRMG